MQISDGNNRPRRPISGSSRRGGAMGRTFGRGRGEARAGGGGKEWKKDGERQWKRWRRRSRVPEIAPRNPSGAPRTGIGFRFCRGEGANIAHPTKEPFWGENSPFSQQGAGCGKEGAVHGCVAACLRLPPPACSCLPAQTAAAEPLSSLLRAGRGGHTEPRDTHRGPGHPHSVPSSCRTLS